jgi:hypothetical protein
LSARSNTLRYIPAPVKAVNSLATPCAVNWFWESFKTRSREKRPEEVIAKEEEEGEEEEEETEGGKKAVTSRAIASKLASLRLFPSRFKHSSSVNLPIPCHSKAR